MIVQKRMTQTKYKNCSAAIRFFKWGVMAVVLLCGVNAHAQQCPTPSSGGNIGIIPPVDACADISTAVYGFYPLSFPAGCNIDPQNDIIFDVDWGDGTSIRTDLAPTAIDLMGGTTYWYYFGARAPGPLSTMDPFYTHTYVRSLDNCSFIVTVTARIKGTREFIREAQYPVTTYHQRDDYWGARPLVMIEPVTGQTVYLVCVGQAACIRFQDVSMLNCNPAANDPGFEKNNDPRHLQFEYGTTVAAGNTIPGITVAGQAYTNASGGRIPASNRLDGGYNGTTVMTDGTYRTITNPGETTGALTNEICVPNTTTEDDIGKEFRVSLYLWNKCNPLGNTPPSDADRSNAATTEAIIRIVPSPQAPIDWKQSFCNRTNNNYINSQYTATLTHDPGAMRTGTYYYYRDDGSGTGPDLSQIIYTNTGPAADNTTTGFNPVTLALSAQDRLDPSIPQEKIYWVVYEYINPVSLNNVRCMSQPAKITYIIREDISAQPGIPTYTLTPTGKTTVCPGETVRFHVNGNDPMSYNPPAGYGGEIMYEWESGANYTVTATEPNNGAWADITFDATGPVAGANITVTMRLHRRWKDEVTVPPSGCTTGAECNFCVSASRSFTIVLDSKPSAALLGDGTICAGETLPITINTFRGAPNTTSYDVVLDASGTVLPIFNVPTSKTSETYTANPADGTITTYGIQTITSLPNGCTNGPLGSVLINKRESLTLTDPLDATTPVCAGNNISAQLPAGNPNPSGNTTVGGATQYVWSYNGANYTGTSTTSPAIPAGAAVSNIESAFRNVTVVWQYTTDAAQSSGNKRCPSLPLTKEIEIRPAPTATINPFTPNRTICSDATNTTIDIDVAGTPNIDWVITWRVDASAAVSQTIPGNTSGTATASVTIDKATYLPATGSYTFELLTVAQATGGCSGTRVLPYTAQIKVLKQPEATIGGPIIDVCQDTEVEIDITLSGENTGVYRVEYTAGGTAQSANFTVPLGSPKLLIPASLIDQGNQATTVVTIVSVTESTTALNGTSISCSNTGGTQVTIRNTRNHTPADAGPDDGQCETDPPPYTRTLAGNSPDPGNHGAWTVITGPPGGYTFLNATQYNSTFTSQVNGRYELMWTISPDVVGVCPATSDKVVLDFGKTPNQAYAGANDKWCYDLSDPRPFRLAANAPDLTTEAGRWTEKAGNPGTATFSDPANNQSTVTVSAYGQYTFIWELYNICEAKPSEVTINFVETPGVSLIPVQEWCPDVPIPTNSDFPVFTPSVDLLVPGAASVFNWTFVGAETLGFPANGNGNFPNGIPRSNNTVSNITAKLRVTENNQGCSNSRDVDIILKPRPRLAAVTPTAMCHGATVTFELNPMLSQPVTYNWNNSDPSIGLAATGGSPVGDATTPPFRYQFAAQNMTDAPISAYISNLTATVNGCTSLPANVTLTVNPFVLLTPPTPEICPEDQVMPGETTIISNVTNTTTTYSWSYAGPYIGFTVPSSATGDNIGTFTAIVNEGSAPVGGTVTVTGTANGCSSTIYYDITVKPRPVIAPILPESLCPTPDNAADGLAGGTFTSISFSSTNLASDVIYNWKKVSPFGGATSGTGDPTPADLSFNDNTYGFVQTYTWTVTATGDAASPAKGCDSRPVTFLRNVNPRPLTLLFPASQELCSGSRFSNITFADNALGISTFQWSITEPAGISTGANILSGSGTITFPNPANNSTPASVTVPVTIRATSLAGCVGPNVTASLRINPSPVMETLSPVDECSNTPVGPVTFSTVAGGVTPDNYTWSISDPSVAQSLPSGATVASQMQQFTTASNNTAVNRQAIVTVFASAGGCNSAPVTFPVTVRPIPKVNPVANQEVCPHVGVNIPAFSTNLTGNDASIINWTLDNPDIAAPALSASGSGNIAAFTAAPNGGSFGIPATPLTGVFKLVANMRWTTSNGVLTCSGPTTEFTVTVKPTPGFTLPPQTDLEFCHGDFVPSIVFNSTDNGVTFNWSSAGDNIGLTNTSGTGNLPAFTASNNTYQRLSAGVLNIKVIASASACAGDPMDFTLTVKPVPQLDNYPNVNVCGGVPITPPPFSLNPSIIPESHWPIEYQWQIVNNWIPESNLPVGIQTGNIPYFTPDTSRITYPSNRLWGDTPTTMRVTVTPFLGGCEGVTKDVYVQLNPLPVTTIGSDKENCVFDSGIKLYYANSGKGASGSKYIWSIENPSPPPPADQPALDNISDSTSYVVAIYPDNAIHWNGTLTVQEKNTFHCLGGKISMPIQVIPYPKVEVGPDREVCFGDTVILNGRLTSTPVYGVTYSWTPQSYMIADNETLNPVVEPKNTITYYLEAIEGNDVVGTCRSQEPAAVTVTVVQSPVAPMVPYMTYCESDPLLRMNSFGSPASTDVMHWQRLYESLSGAFVVNGSRYDTIQISNCDSTSLSMRLKADHPEALPWYPLDWCDWNATQSMDTTILYQLYVSRQQGALNCKSPMTTTQLTVRRAPTAPESHDFTYCVEPHNPLYTLTARATSANAPIINWYDSNMNVVGSGESFSVFQQGVSPVATPETAGLPATYTPFDFYAETSTGYCRSPLTRVPLTIYPNPELDFSLNDEKGCSPFELIAANTSPSVFADYHWVWEPGDTTKYAAFIDRQHTYYATGSIAEQARLQLIGVSTENKNSETGIFCRSIKEQTLIVYPEVKANFSATIYEGCHPLNVIFTASGYTVGAYKFRWYWDRPDLSPGVSNPPATTDDPVNDPTAGLLYGVQGPNPPHTFENGEMAPKDYHVWLQVDNGACFDSKDTIITVYSIPNASFTHNLSQGSICPPDSVMLTNTSNGPSNDPVNTLYAWNFANGILDTVTIAKSPIYQKYENWASPAPVPYTVMMTAYNQYDTRSGKRLTCSSTTNQYFLVNPQVEAKFTGPVDGCAPFDARFQTQSIGSISFYGWDFGDGSPSDSRPTPQHQFNSSPTHSDVMTYTVTHTVRNSFCTDVVSQPFTLYPQPAANFVVDKTSGCQPLEVTFTNTSNNGPYPNPSTGMTYIYDYRDGRADSLYTTDPVKHSFINTLGQNLPVSPVMTAMNQWGCTNNFSQSLTIFPFVKADFIMDYPDDGCSPLVVNFRNGSQGYATYQYTFGDGTQKDGTRTDNVFYQKTYDNPSMYMDQTYQVTLRVEAGGTGCWDAVTRPLLVRAKPTADFRPGPPYPGDYIHPVTSIQIDNLIQPDIARESLRYLWSWSEQGSGYLNNFSSSIYPSPLMIPDWGYFNITQRVTAPNGICTDSKTVTIHIVPPAAQADFKDVPPDCMPYEVTFENTSRNANAYVWNFGDGVSSGLTNPTHVYLDAGTYTVTLTATGDNPFPSTKIKTIVVHPTPQAAFEVSPKYLWVGQALRAFNYSTHTDSNGLPYEIWYRWDWGDNTPTDTVENPSHMYLKAGTYQISLTVGTHTDPQCVSKYIKSDAVDIEKSGDIILPNIFKPLTSGEPSNEIQDRGYRNYLFYPPVLSPVRKYHFVVYSRVGQLLFETSNPQRGWNGYFKGRLCDEGVYTYKIEGVYETGQAFFKMGDVTILR